MKPIITVYSELLKARLKSISLLFPVIRLLHSRPEPVPAQPAATRHLVGEESGALLGAVHGANGADVPASAAGELGAK